MPTPAPAPAASPVPSGANSPTGANSGKAPQSRFNRDSIAKINPLELDSGGGEKILRYPTVVGTEEFPHYVAFYPLVRDKSSYGKSLGASGRVVDQSEQNRVDPENGGAAAATAGAIAGLKTGGALALPDVLSKGGGKTVGKGAALQAVKSVSTGVVKGLISGAVGAAGGAIASGIAGESKLLFGDRSIVLHVSDRVSTSYKANWETADLGGLVGAIAAGKINSDGFFNKETGEMDMASLGSGAAQMGGEAADYMARKASKLAGIVGGDKLLNVLESTSKTVENPYKEQLFRHMGFRGFVFDYKFSPRDETEAETIFGPKGILYTFIRNMHPEQSAQGLFMTYPSEFLIIFYHAGAENEHIRKISNCALTDMSIDYGAEGFTTFSNGCPTEVTIRLQFTELETLTSDRIEKGF